MGLNQEPAGRVVFKGGDRGPWSKELARLSSMKKTSCITVDSRWRFTVNCAPQQSAFNQLSALAWSCLLHIEGRNCWLPHTPRLVRTSSLAWLSFKRHGHGRGRRPKVGWRCCRGPPQRWVASWCSCPVIAAPPCSGAGWPSSPRSGRSTVTVALQRPGGAFYEDVPKHVRQLAAKLRVVADKLTRDQPRWLHDGDEESGQHDDECLACEYEALLARVQAALA